MKIQDLNQLRQAAAIVQPHVNEMCNAKDVETVVKCLEIVKTAISSIYTYKIEELTQNS